MTVDNRLKRIFIYGQSIWLDFITKSLIESGEMDNLITSDGIRGMTSNPSIFFNAMTKTGDYENSLAELAISGLSAEEIYETLAVRDIQAAADRLREIYDSSNGTDGFVSLEVSPELSDDTQGTIKEARRLWDKVNRPNLMIKVPGNSAGLPAVETLLSEGINVNITLLFSLDNYHQVRETYIRALENRANQGRPIDNVSSVASFFISRIDTLVDSLLEEKIKSGTTEAGNLLGEAAVASAKIAYSDFLKDFNSSRFEELRRKGAQFQRPLWASTSTKNPKYSDVKYVEPLIGKNTVNTLPLATIDAFRDHGNAAETIGNDLDKSYDTLKKIEGIGISMKKVTDKLQDEGIRKFVDSFRRLMNGLEEKRKQLIAK